MKCVGFFCFFPEGETVNGKVSVEAVFVCSTRYPERNMSRAERFSFESLESLPAFVKTGALCKNAVTEIEVCSGRLLWQMWGCFFFFLPFFFFLIYLGISNNRKSVLLLLPDLVNLFLRRGFAEKWCTAGLGFAEEPAAPARCWVALVAPAGMGWLLGQHKKPTASQSGLSAGSGPSWRNLDHAGREHPLWEGAWPHRKASPAAELTRKPGLCFQSRG